MIITPRKRGLILPATLAFGLAAPAIILAPRLVEALQVAGVAQPSRFTDINALPPKVEAAFRRAMMMQAKMSGLTGDNSPVPKVLTYQTHAEDAANLTTYTFSSQAIGTAKYDRRVIVGVSWNSSQTISSATIGGVSADIIVQHNSGANRCGIIIAAVPTGTTADVVITFSGGLSRCGIGVWSATGLSSNTAVDSDWATAVSNVSTSVTIDTVADGFTVAIACGFISAGATCSWANVTERYDTSMDTSGIHSGADASTSGSTITPTPTFSTGGTSGVCAASW